MIKIKEVKRKGDLMIMLIEDDATPSRSFNLEIDANVDEDTLWNHIRSHYEILLKDELEPEVDDALEKKWKGKKKVI